MVLEGRKRSKEIRPAFLFLCLLFLPARAVAAPGEWMERTTLRARTGPGVSALRDNETDRRDRSENAGLRLPGDQVGDHPALRAKGNDSGAAQQAQALPFVGRKEVHLGKNGPQA